MADQKIGPLASWFRRVTDRWLALWLDRMRRDPDVSLADFLEAEKAMDDHLRKMDEIHGKDARNG